MNKEKVGLAPEAKRTRDVRNGILLAHVVLSFVVVAAVRFKWWTVIAHGDTVGEFFGSQEQAFQTGYITLAALLAFFFTSYDIVTNSDIQWPPLLLSAFALGCAAEVTWKLNAEQDVVLRHVVEAQLNREMADDLKRQKTTPKLSSSDVAGISSGETSDVTSSARSSSSTDPGIRVRLGAGLLTTLFGTLSMVLLSSYLTFFARREGQ